MDMPWGTITLLSASGALALSRFAPQFSLGGSLVYTFLFLEISLVLVGIVWSAGLYPWFFSPLRHLPTPEVSLLSIFV